MNERIIDIIKRTAQVTDGACTNAIRENRTVEELVERLGSHGAAVIEEFPDVEEAPYIVLQTTHTYLLALARGMSLFEIIKPDDKEWLEEAIQSARLFDARNVPPPTA